MFNSQKGSWREGIGFFLNGFTIFTLGLAIAAFSASAQESNKPSNPSSSSSTNPTNNPSTGNASSSTAGATTPNPSNASKNVARGDHQMMVELAEANLAEIQTSRLALEKTQNEQVKKFAQKMVDDHTQALQELETVAQSKGVRLPDSPDMTHRLLTTTMRAMTAQAFDTQYIQRMGINAHQRTSELLEKIQRSAQDTDFKALATKQLPIVQNHLQLAQQMARPNEQKQK